WVCETGLFVKRDSESGSCVTMKPVGRDFQLIVARRQVEKAVVAAGIGRGLELYPGIDGGQCDSRLRDRAPVLVRDHAVERGADVLRRRNSVKKRQKQHDSQEVSLSYACHFRLLGGWWTSDPIYENALSESAFAYIKKAPRA